MRWREADSPRFQKSQVPRRLYGGALPLNYHEARSTQTCGRLPQQASRTLGLARAGNSNSTSTVPSGLTRTNATAAKRLNFAATAARKSRTLTTTTFSLTLRHSSIRVLMAIRAQLGLRASRHDLVAAFLQGSLQENELIFMRAHGPAQLRRIGQPEDPSSIATWSIRSQQTYLLSTASNKRV